MGHVQSRYHTEIALDEPFDLRATLSSGAAFGWGRYNRRGRLLAYGEPDSDGWFTSPTFGNLFRLRQPAPLKLEIESDTPLISSPALPRPMSLEEFVRWYFRMEEKLSDLIPRISRDPHVDSACRSLPGLRLIRVEPYECLLSFLCSPQNRIAKIAQILNAVSRHYGERVKTAWGTFYLLPCPARLARARPVRLAACGLRYGKPQARNIIRTFTRLLKKENFFLENSSALKSYASSHQSVRETCLGAGPKVADCVCLFALGHLEAVPVDVHVFNATVKLYRRHLPGLRARDADFLGLREYERIGRFYRRKFGKDAGYAQQFLFTAQRLGLFSPNTPRRSYRSPTPGRC